MSSCEMWAVVPVKPFHLAKQRLISVLDEQERIELARVMLRDVLSALDACSHRLAGVIVVTADHEASAIARQHDAIVFGETGPGGMNVAISLVVARLARRAGSGMIVVPGDLPHICASDIEAMVDLIRRAPSVALVRANDGGTNLLACRPAPAIAPAFGPDSFNAHCVGATRSGITPTVRFAPHLQLDIDWPEDLVSFLARESTTRTHLYLSKLHVHRRLQDQPRDIDWRGSSERGRGGIGS